MDYRGHPTLLPLMLMLTLAPYSGEEEQEFVHRLLRSISSGSAAGVASPSERPIHLPNGENIGIFPNSRKLGVSAVESIRGKNSERKSAI